MTKIMFYNIFEGCATDHQFNQLHTFINEERPDILGLSELNNWENGDFEKLKQFCVETCMFHYLFGPSPQGYHVGLFSRIPFARYTRLQGFKTSAVSAEIAMDTPLQVVVTHLHSDNEARRLAELTILKKKVSLTMPTILMGDMNALSKSDGYNETALLSRLNAVGLTKFGTDRLNFELIEAIEKWGLADTHHLTGSAFAPSVPTSANMDEAHLAPLRLDYAFASNHLKDRIVSSEIVRNQMTETISDHYPVRLVLK